MKLKRAFLGIKSFLVDDTARRRYQFLCVYAALALVSFIMTLLNIITEKGVLTVVTLVFALCCTTAFLLLNKGIISQQVSELFFCIIVYVVFLYFIISGNPDGFSILWICLLPACGLLLLGRKHGSIAVFGLLLLILFLFYVPAGRSLLLYEYNKTFMQRFPLLYSSFYLVGYLLEWMRVAAYQELEKMREQYQYQANHDALTGLYNRLGFNEIIDRILDERNSDIMLMIVDLDNFKRINDNYGHSEGDKVLIDIAHAIDEIVGGKGSVCRWGGEEFAVIIPDCADNEELPEIIRSAIEHRSIQLQKACVSLTASIGTALVTSGSTAQQIVNIADKCLYKAKDGGRNLAITEKI